jgi:ferredoxin
MEGNGPRSGGNPRNIGCIISGFNPFAADLVCAEIIGVPDEVIMLEYASERGLCPSSVRSLKLTGDDIGMFKVPDFAKPDTRRSKKLRSLPRFFSPHPFVSRKKCIGCGICCESCPKKTIVMISADDVKKAEIKDKAFIRCFCCQELCPAKAILIKKHFIFKLLY